MYKILKYIVMVYFLIFSLEGCAYMAHYKELTALKRFSESKHDMENYIIKQDESFNKLLDDVKNSRVKKDLSKKEVISRYGDPIFCRASKKQANAGEACLYRQAFNYFSSDAVYLYFDENEKLYSWELKPAS